MFTAIVIVISVILVLATVFYGFHKTGSQRVKLKASWKSGLEFEVERSKYRSGHLRPTRGSL